MGRLAKLSSELEQAFTPFQDALVSAPEGFIDEVLAHESEDVAGQRFQIACQRKLADTKLSIAEEQLVSALQVDGKDAWGRLYDNITGSLQVTLEDGSNNKMGFSQAASVLYGTDFDAQKPAWLGIKTRCVRTKSPSLRF